MERLREITDESVRLWGHDGDRIVLLENMESRQAVRSVLQPGGTTIPLHASGRGQGHARPVARTRGRRSSWPSPLAALTPQTITDPAVLREQLRAIRRRGYAETHREAWKDVGAVAAAIHDPSGRPVAAIALALPMHRLTEQLTRRYGKAVAEAVEALSAELAGSIAPSNVHTVALDVAKVKTRELCGAGAVGSAGRSMAPADDAFTSMAPVRTSATKPVSTMS